MRNFFSFRFRLRCFFYLKLKKTNISAKVYPAEKKPKTLRNRSLGMRRVYNRLLIGESCSALSASSLQNLTSVRGLHSLHETVLLLSLKLFRLICSLHNLRHLLLQNYGSCCAEIRFGITTAIIINTKIVYCQVFLIKTT